jgi:hypothetical protein
MDRGQVFLVWRASALSAERNLSGTIVLCVNQEAGTLSTRRVKVAVFDPDANIARQNRALIYMGARMIAGTRLARESK